MNYVSVTGGVNKEEVEAISREFQEAGFSKDSAYFPSIGFLVSEKTLKGEKTQNLRFAEFKDVPDLIEIANKTIVPIIHYNTRNLDTLSKQVMNVMQEVYDDHICRHLQLNVTWPHVSEVKKIKKHFKDMLITLQISHKSMMGLHIDEIANKVSSYKDSLDYVLIDPSKGRGIEFNPEDSAALYREIKALRPKYSIVLAGGLDGDNVEDILLEVMQELEHNDFSIDAEGRLRDKINDNFFGNDILNIGKVRRYLQGAARILLR